MSNSFLLHFPAYAAILNPGSGFTIHGEGLFFYYLMRFLNI